jgi:hypothetical protein
MIQCPPSTSGFEALMAEATKTTDRFGHREHVHLTWLAVRRFGVPAAVGLVSDGIQRTARYAGAPQKYHATVSRFPSCSDGPLPHTSRRVD